MFARRPKTKFDDFSPSGSHSPRLRQAMTGLLVLSLVWLSFLAAGCGGGGEEAEAEAERPHSMVPANIDSLIAETSVDTSPETGTAGATDSQGMMDEESSHPTGVEPETVVQEVSPPAEAATAVSSEPTTQVRGSSNQAGAFSLQVGSFRQENYASRLAAQLLELGHESSMEVADVGGVQYHRVFIRGLDSRSRAENLGEELRDKLGINYLVLRKP